jgi:hypothetical protein
MYVFELTFAKRDFQCKVNFIKIYFEMNLVVFEYLFTQ